MNDEILLCWDAPHFGFKTLTKVVDAFVNDVKIPINKVIYLYCEYMCESDLEDNCGFSTKERIEFLNKIDSYSKITGSDENAQYQKKLIDFHKVQKINFAPTPMPKVLINSENADLYLTIQNLVEEYLIHKLVFLNPKGLHISLNSGTQAMRSAWLTLHSQSFFNAYFGENVKLWAFSDEAINRNKASNRLREQIIKQNPYITKIANSKYIESKSDRINLDSSGIIKKTATIDAPFLLLGERGTGKSYIVDEIYNTKVEAGIIKEGARMIVEVCGALDGNLVDDRLFGHWKGAFTGAETDEPGDFETCNGGLLFLDEIQDIPKFTQRRILRAINEGRISRLGHPKDKRNNEIKVKFSLICASNKTLKELQESDKLDPDFLDRIARFICTMKPLRELDESTLREAWNARWRSSIKEGLALPEEPDNFGLVKGALLESRMYGNIRDMNQLIAYIARDVYEGTIEISTNKKKQKYEDVLKKWKEDYDAKYSSGTLADKPVQKGHTQHEILEKNGWDGMVKLFKQWLSTSAKEIYGSDKTAAKRLKTTDRTLRDARKTDQSLV